MKKFKRMIALLTVAVFLLGVVAAPAAAATKEEAFGRLNALDVAVGDQNGDPQYDKNFTRAEAAAIMVNLSGMNAAIEAAKGKTNFKDVPATHWASGVINLAVGAGIIKGYGNNIYKPDQNVTYAEMSAMLIGVLGYTPKLQGVWPSNVIGKAAQLGLLDGVSVTDYNAAAVRSNVFLAADNALDTAVLKEMKDGYQEGNALMVEKLNVTKQVEATVSDVPILGTLNKDEIKLSWNDNGAKTKTLKLADGIDANKYLGLKGIAWVKDDKCFFFDVKTASSDIIVDQVKAITGTTVTLKDKDKTYDFATSPSKFFNFDSSVTEVAKIAKDDDVKVVLENGKVNYLIATRYDNGLVDKVDTAANKLTLKKATGVSTLEFDNKNVTLTRNGVAVKLDAVKVGDAVSYLHTSKIAYVQATDATKSGKFTACNSAADSLTIDGKATDTISGGAWVSKDNGTTWESGQQSGSSKYDGLFGENVKVLLNVKGEIVAALFGGEGASNYITVLVKKIKFFSSDEVKKIFVTKADGTQTSYVVTKDTKIEGVKITDDKNDDYKLTNGTVAKDVNIGQIVRLTLTADGKVDAIKVDTDKMYNALGAQGNYYVNKATDTIKVDTTGPATPSTGFKVDSNTKILKVKKYVKLDGTTDATNVLDPISGAVNAAVDNYVDDTESVTWSSMESLDNGTGAAIANGNVAVYADGGNAKLIVIFNKTASVSTDYKYAWVTGSGVDGDGGYFKLFNKDINNLTYTNDSALSATKGYVVRFKLDTDNDIESGAVYADAGTPIGSSIYYYVYEVDTTKNRIKVINCTEANQTGVAKGSQTYTVPASGDANAIWVDVNDKTLFADSSGFWDDKASTAIDTSLTLGSLAKGDIIMLYDVQDNDGDFAPQSAAADSNPAFNAGEEIYDFVARVHK